MLEAGREAVFEHLEGWPAAGLGLADGETFENATDGLVEVIRPVPARS